LSFFAEIDAQVPGFGAKAFGWTGVDSSAAVAWHMHLLICWQRRQLWTSVGIVFASACGASFVGSFMLAFAFNVLAGA
jgi:hypothetical protein